MQFEITDSTGCVVLKVAIAMEDLAMLQAA
jgi:hypothetical protein